MKIVVNNSKAEPSDNSATEILAKAYAILEHGSDKIDITSSDLLTALKLVHDLAVLKSVNLLGDNMTRSIGSTVDAAIHDTLTQCDVDLSQLRDLKPL